MAKLNDEMVKKRRWLGIRLKGTKALLKTMSDPATKECSVAERQEATAMFPIVDKLVSTWDIGTAAIENGSKTEKADRGL